MRAFYEVVIRLLHVSFLALALGACATSAPTQKVMTYNIRLHLASDGPDAWPHRKEAVAGIIRSHRADLVGLQEALPDQLTDLDALLPGFARFGTGRNAERSGEHSAVYYRSDRFELVEHDTFWLSETPSVAGSKGWDAAYERIVTWGKLRDRKSGTLFFHFNTHFDHVGVEARRESAKLLVNRIAAIAGPAPVIVTGDFNDIAGSEPLQILTASGLRDAPHQGPASTWNGFKAIVPGRKIDFILVRGPVEVLRHAVIVDLREDGRFPSDHFPVIADVRIGND